MTREKRIKIELWLDQSGLCYDVFPLSIINVASWAFVCWRSYSSYSYLNVPNHSHSTLIGTFTTESKTSNFYTHVLLHSSFNFTFSWNSWLHQTSPCISLILTRVIPKVFSPWPTHQEKPHPLFHPLYHHLHHLPKLHWTRNNHHSISNQFKWFLDQALLLKNWPRKDNSEWRFSKTLAL